MDLLFVILSTKPTSLPARMHIIGTLLKQSVLSLLSELLYLTLYSFRLSVQPVASDVEVTRA